MIGSQLLQYQIKQKLGEGGMGEVYLAQDTNLGRQVAIKILSSRHVAEPLSRQRFMHEAKAQSMLSHPNIVTFHEVVHHDDTTFIVMEFVEGQALSAYARATRLSTSDVLDLAIQIGEGVCAAHAHGIVHRDIKPDNIMVTPDGRVKITDFGLARWIGATTLTQKGARLGSAYYMSPEQAESRKVDHRSDLFSIGVLIYELLCGQRPFEGDSEAVILYELVHTQPPPLAHYCRGAPDELERIVTKCLLKDPDQRYQSAADLVADLKHVRQQLKDGTSINTPGISQVHSKPRYKRVILLSVAGAMAITAFWLSEPESRHAWFARLGFKPAESRMRLVVIPLSGVGDQPPNQAFLDGLLETLTSKLTQTQFAHGALSMVPASDVRRVGVTSVREAREAFGASHVVTGSLQGLPGAIRVTMNLVDAKKGVQLGSFVIDGASASSFALQDSLAAKLASLVETEFGPGESALVSNRGTSSPQAYDNYLKGLGYFERYSGSIGLFTPARVSLLDSAVEMYQRAIQEDEHYASAYAGLGRAYWRRFKVQPDSVWLASATASALRAKELDDALALAHLALGEIHQGTGEYSEASHDYKDAIRLEPRSVEARYGLAQALVAMNRPDEAEKVYKEVIDLRPDYIKGYYDLELFYLRFGRNEDARGLLNTVVQLQPTGYDSWNKVGNMYGAIYYQLGEWDKAGEIWQKSLSYGPSYAAYSNLGTVHYMKGRYADAAHMYTQALAIDDRDYRVWINLASVYEQLPAEKDKVVETYRTAIRLGEEERQINPKDASLLAQLADCYAIVQDTLQALGLADQAQELAPDNPEIAVRAGFVNERLGKRERALELIRKALDLGFPRAQLEAQPELVDLLKDPSLQKSLSTR